MQKHKYNIYPEMQADEYAELLADIKANGYDESQPIYLYEGDILDGWNRQRACNELGVTPKYETFEGGDFEAIMFVIRTNKRRNLNSSQKACIAADADEIIKVIAEQVEAERRQKISERENFGNQYTDKVETGELIPPFPNPEKEAKKTRSKVAKMFDTNSRYVSDAIKLKETNPEKFEQVKAGYKTLPEVKKEQKIEDKEAIKKEIHEKLAAQIQSNGISDITEGWYRVGNQYLYYGDSRSDAFINFIPSKAQFAFADPPYNANVGEWDSNFIWQHDYLINLADVIAVTPGGWNAYEFYRQTEMNYIWEMVCYIKNGMTHGKCGYANFIKCSIFGNKKPSIMQDLWAITIKINETDDTNYKGRKPYDFMIHLIDIFSAEQGIIIDPFAGSGTTLLVCESMNRISYNAEIQKVQCIEIINRAINKGLTYERV